MTVFVPHSAAQLRQLAADHRQEAETLAESAPYLPPARAAAARDGIARHRQLARELDQAALRREATGQ